MNTLDFTIDNEELQILFLHCKDAYKGYTFEMWVAEIKEVYAAYFMKRQNPMSFFEWVNGQILALAY